MWKVHQFSEPEPVITVNGPQAPDEFNIKRLTYEVFGSVGKTAGSSSTWTSTGIRIRLIHIHNSALVPQETTTLTVASGSISVHVHGGQVGCRMLVDGVITATNPRESDDHQDARRRVQGEIRMSEHRLDEPRVQRPFVPRMVRSFAIPIIFFWGFLAVSTTPLCPSGRVARRTRRTDGPALRAVAAGAAAHRRKVSGIQFHQLDHGGLRGQQTIGRPGPRYYDDLMRASRQTKSTCST